MLSSQPVLRSSELPKTCALLLFAWARLQRRGNLPSPGLDVEAVWEPGNHLYVEETKLNSVKSCPTQLGHVNKVSRTLASTREHFSQLVPGNGIKTYP